MREATGKAESGAKSEFSTAGQETLGDSVVEPEEGTYLIRV